MNFTVFYGPQPKKILSKLQKDVARRIVRKLDSLSYPVPQDARPVVGHNAFRIRIGPYRALYRIEGHKIVFFKIGKRARVYQ